MRSDPLTKGINAAPQRSLLKALGLCDAEIGKPLIGVVSSQNDIVPGHMNLDKIVNAVKQGVALGGGVPIVFPAIAVCDGLAMGHVGMKYSLVSRELICDSTEAMATAHPFDGLVLVAACDKNVPGLLMAAARLNIPSIVISGGAMLAGHFEGRKVSYSNISEAVSQFRTGKITPIQFEDLENKACPSCGSCSGMFTANSMNCLTEALGLSLPGNGTIVGRALGSPASGQGKRHEDHGARQEQRVAAPDHDKGCVPKRSGRRHGSGVLHQLHAASACHRA